MGDIRYAIGSPLKRPVFAAIAVATLALGIGANTAIFSVVNAILLRPLPFATPERIVNLGMVNRHDLLRLFTTARVSSWQDHHATSHRPEDDRRVQ